MRVSIIWMSDDEWTIVYTIAFHNVLFESIDSRLKTLRHVRLLLRNVIPLPGISIDVIETTVITQTISLIASANPVFPLIDDDPPFPRDCPPAKRFRLRPSSRLLTVGIPARSANVGCRSIPEPICLITFPFSNLAGHLMCMARHHPHRSILSAFHISIPSSPFGPLSWKKTTIVLSAIPRSSSFSRTLPTFQSMFSHIAKAERR